MTMLHKLKVSTSKGTGKRAIISHDESHKFSQNLLKEWKAMMISLSTTLDANTTAWSQVLASYTKLQASTDSIYSSADKGLRNCIKALQDGRASIGQPPSSFHPAMPQTPVQQLDRAKEQVNALLERIGRAEKLQASRIEATRQFTYYERKTNQLMQKGEQGDLTKLARNQKTAAESSINLNNITAQLYAELQAIDFERLTVADRAVSALLRLQNFYCQANPARAAMEKAEEIGLGKRTAPQELRDWASLKPPQVAATGSQASSIEGVQELSTTNQPFTSQQGYEPQPGFAPQAQGYQPQQGFMQVQHGFTQQQQAYV